MAYLGKKGWIQGHILGEITDLKFENHKNVKKNGYSAHSNKLGQIYVQQDSIFQILRYVWACSVARKNILYKMHIVHCKVLPLFAQGVFEGVALILLVSFARQIQFFPGTFLPEGDWALSKCEWKLFDWWGGRICCEEAKCWSSISQTYPCFCRSAYTCIFYTF